MIRPPQMTSRVFVLMLTLQRPWRDCATSLGLAVSNKVQAQWVWAVNKIVDRRWLTQGAAAIVICTFSATNPCHAQAIQLRQLVHISTDCSAYRWHEGAWMVLRRNTVTLSGKVAREVMPEDDPEIAKLIDGTSLKRNLDLYCARSKS